MRKLKLITFSTLFFVGFIMSTSLIGKTAVINSFYDLSFNSLDGKPLPIEAYQGKVVLVVNTASKCGYTPQYADLQQLHEKYHENGLVILALPSGDFGQQEFMDPLQVRQFTNREFHVTFQLLDISHVKGKNKHPFYQWVEAELGEKELPKWNFHKYLINREGK
tara:strand:+ start:72014 stop:72505 length:492 start_codon:yes stop_codon:yes gene_type:complete